MRWFGWVSLFPLFFSCSIGNLALSRAVGDFEFKQNYSLDAEHQVVTVNPDIIVHQSTGEEEFIVVACDGESIDIRYKRETG